MSEEKQYVAVEKKGRKRQCMSIEGGRTLLTEKQAIRLRQEYLHRGISLEIEEPTSSDKKSEAAWRKHLETMYVKHINANLNKKHPN